MSARITIKSKYEHMMASLLEMVAVRRQMGGHDMTKVEKLQLVEWAHHSKREKDMHRALDAHINLGIDLILNDK